MFGRTVVFFSPSLSVVSTAVDLFVTPAFLAAAFLAAAAVAARTAAAAASWPAVFFFLAADVGVVFFLALAAGAEGAFFLAGWGGAFLNCTSESELSESELLLDSREDDRLLSPDALLDTLEERVALFAGGAFFFPFVALEAATAEAALDFFWGVNFGGLGDLLAAVGPLLLEAAATSLSLPLLALKMLLYLEDP